MGSHRTSGHVCIWHYGSDYNEFLISFNELLDASDTVYVIIIGNMFYSQA